MSTKGMNGTEKKVFAYIESNRLLCPQDKIVVGVSGGADSVCLLLMLLEYSRQVPLEIGVVHVHHGLRGEEADADAAYVKKLCEQSGVAFELVKVDVRSFAAREKCSEEDAGRRLRYQAFEERAQEIGAEKIAVAHHMEDQAETVLFHLFRGSGLRGLTGMKPRQGKIIRPLLCLRKGEIEKYLEERGIRWCEDATNAGDAYARNRLRHHVLPCAEEIASGAVEHIARTARSLSETEDFLAKETENALEKCVFTQASGNIESAWKNKSEEETQFARTDRKDIESFSIDVTAFCTYHHVLQKRMLLTLAERLSPTGKDIEEVHVQEMLSLFEKEGNREIMLPMGIRAWRSYGTVILARVEIEREKSLLQLPELIFQEIFPQKGEGIPQNQCTKWFDYDKIKGTLKVRYRKEGDYLTLRGAQGEMIHKSLQDYMVNEKIPKQKRDAIPLLAEGSQVIWLIGYRISENYKITENTRRILQVSLKQNSDEKMED